ncbi:MAG: hypothetical protein ACREO8_12300, partial [Luteimonas sp.]
QLASPVHARTVCRRIKRPRACCVGATILGRASRVFFITLLAKGWRFHSFLIPAHSFLVPRSSLSSGIVIA